MKTTAVFLLMGLALVAVSSYPYNNNNSNYNIGTDFVNYPFNETFQKS